MPTLRSLVLGLSLMPLAACTTWRLQTAPTETVLAEPRDRARVWLADGSRIDVLSPRVRADTLVGRSRENEAMRVAVPLSAVRGIELHEADWWRTAQLGGTVLLVVLVALAAALVAVFSAPGQ